MSTLRSVSKKLAYVPFAVLLCVFGIASYLFAAGGPGVGVLVNGVYVLDIGTTAVSVSNKLSVVTHSATEAETSANMYDKRHLVTGAYTITLPAVAVGMSATFRATTAAVMCIDSNVADQFILGATALSAGFKICSDGTLGATVSLEVLQANKISVFPSGPFVDSGA